MKLKVFFLSFICSILFLTGCVKNNNKMETIKFSTWGSSSEMAILKPIISDFERQNPNIKIDLVHIPQDYFQKIHLLFASNLAPDVVFINNLNLPIYTSRLEPLNYNKNIYYKESIDALSYKGKTYAVPRDVSNLVIYYNKDLFDKYNVPYPKTNWTMENLLSTAKNLTSKNTFGIGYEEDIYYALPYIMSFGGGILGNDLKTELINTKQSQTGLTFYKNLANKYHVAPQKYQVGSKTIAQMFLNQEIAMHLSGRWMTPKYRESAEFNWDVAAFPGVGINKKNGIVPTDASGWAVSKDSKHKADAIKFVMFLSSKSNIEKMTKSGLIVPARIDVSNSPIFLNGKPQSSHVFTDEIKYSKPTPISTNYNRILDNLNDRLFLSK